MLLNFLYFSLKSIYFRIVLQNIGNCTLLIANSRIKWSFIHKNPIWKNFEGTYTNFEGNTRQKWPLYKDWERAKEKNQKNWVIERNEILVSYDVEKLYPSIPIREALDLVECLLKSKPDLRGKTSYSVNSIMSLLR